MKSALITIALFSFTAAAVAFYPAYQNAGTPHNPTPVNPVINPVQHPAPKQHAKVEVVFVLDTTGSMSGLIQSAKEKIWSIASSMAQARPAPEIKMGLVAYRDRGDAYVTKTLDLSADLDTMYAALMDFRADGGGDGPESVNQALHDAVYKMSWSPDQQTYKAVFLVGDAPPHMDYQDDVKYPAILAAAQHKGIVVNAIQCGQIAQTTAPWQRIAQLGTGRYFQVEQAGGAVAIATPYDEKLAKLSEELDKTRLYYGDAKERQKQRRKLQAAEKLHKSASPASRARRAEFNASESGKANFTGRNELVDEVSSGRLDLSGIDKEKLPEPMQRMAPEEQQRLIEQKAETRQKLQSQIRELAQKRSAFIKKKVKEAGGAEDSLDDKLYSAVREQAESKGLRYEAAAPRY